MIVGYGSSQDRWQMMVSCAGIYALERLGIRAKDLSMFRLPGSRAFCEKAPWSGVNAGFRTAAARAI